jgi:uncharacterized protein
MTLIQKFNKLIKIIDRYEKPLLALSGGLDSSFLAFALSRSNTTPYSITITSDFFPATEITRAREISQTYKLRHQTLDMSQRHLNIIASNPLDRCYICKKALFGELSEVLKHNGNDVLFDGTTYDDLNKHRPGLKAKEELGVVSPLALAEITKSELREIARMFKLDFAELPSFSCFATRFPYNSQITKKKVKAVCSAEELIKNLGFKQVRVRYHDNIARVEVSKADIPKLIAEDNYIQITNKLKTLGFEYITLDLEGFRSGSMDIKVNK